VNQIVPNKSVWHVIRPAQRIERPAQRIERRHLTGFGKTEPEEGRGIRNEEAIFC
jgi:hypothetical protein